MQSNVPYLSNSRALYFHHNISVYKLLHFSNAVCIETICCLQHKLYKTARTVPTSLEGVLDEETFEKARLYQLDRSLFGFWSGLYAQLEMTVSY